VFANIISSDLGIDVPDFKNLIAYLKHDDTINLNKLESLFQDLDDANMLMD